MQENSSDENNSCRKVKKKRKNNEVSKRKNKETVPNKKEENNLESEKQLEIQKKLKFIFNEVREKGKYEYNKQELPEHLKYHSDSDSSELSKEKSNNDKDNLNNKCSKPQQKEKLSINLKKHNKIKENNNNKDFEIKYNNNEEKNISDKNKEDKKCNNVRDIIEKLRAKKNEKEDLLRLEKEAEEQSIMREKKNNKNDYNNEDKINESEIEREAEKIRRREKKMQERRIEREKRRKMEEEEKKKKEKEFEERKKEEEIIKDKINYYKKDNSKNLIKKKYRNEEEINLKDNKTNINNNNKINEEKLTKENINNGITEKKDEIKKIKNNKTESIGTYKKPNKQSIINGKIYQPKKGIGIIKGHSQDKIEVNVITSQKLNENKYCKSPNITYTKKRSIGGLRESNFVHLNKSFGDYRPTMEKGNNFKNGIYNIKTLDISSLPDLNSSFDSHLFNINNNFQPSLNNNDYYRTTNKKYNNSTINSGNITNSSNRFVNMNNLFNINGLTNLNGENDFINMSNINYNNNNSFYDLLQPQINPYELNSSYNIGYSNPLINYNYNNTQTNISNILNKSVLGMNNINLNNNFNYNNMNNNMISKSNSCSLINIEDLLVLEDKLKEILNALNKNKIIYNECFDLWNYYFNCSLNGNLEKLFTNIIDSNNVQISVNFILMSILICYDCSFDVDILNQVYSVLTDLLNLNHKNLILIYEYILGKISTDNKNNIWVMKLLNLVNASKNNDYNFNFNEYNINTIEYSMPLMEKINYNTSIIIQNIRVLLKNYKTPKVEFLTSLFKKINEKTYEEINIFFRQFILRIDTLSGSLLLSILLEQNPNLNFKPQPAPYVHTINHKKYTLILDLHETLVHFKPNENNDGEGVLKVRPGITEFLDEMDKYFELIIFSGAIQDYANLLIDAIEENKIYFEHRFYREHMIIIDNEFVKDLTRIGRPLDKIIIVDNLPQNFRLQKENGINIKSFWGEDIYDDALINLTTILTKIAQEGGDLRKGLEKYREDIVIKVTSNISKHDS